MEQSVVNGSVMGIAVAVGCFFIGGWPFALISLAALGWLSREAFDATTVLRTASFGMIWLPYSILRAIGGSFFRSLFSSRYRQRFNGVQRFSDAQARWVCFW